MNAIETHEVQNVEPLTRWKTFGLTGTQLLEILRTPVRVLMTSKEEGRIKARSTKVRVVCFFCFGGSIEVTKCLYSQQQVVDFHADRSTFYKEVRYAFCCKKRETN